MTPEPTMIPEPKEPLRLVVVDDHSLFRQGVIQALGASVRIVGEADDVASGVDVIRKFRPDVVLLDVHLTSGSGADVIAKIGNGEDAPVFLALSVSDSPADVMSLVRAGARGYVTKRISGPDLRSAIAQVMAGNAVFSPRFAGFVLDAFRTEPNEESVPSEIDRLSPRETEVMRLLARGYAYKEIGVELHISVRTVESHTSSVLRKLQLSNRHELTHWAARNHIV